MKNKSWLLILSILYIFIGGCSDKRVSFAELYNGDLQEITKVTITDGSTGNLHVIDSPEIISELTRELNNITFTLLKTNKEEINGVLYGIAFYEDEEEPSVTMTTNIVGENVFKTNENLEDVFKKYYSLGQDLE
ncbi:hypothetical protein [Cytobacillus dafuensis]|uniref:DUF4825 domain-containing protein n=1 Tax=Cytobacillus dafuensis TaxID=1742359 RepID=A0A5B8Z937_CYTDA|nr:hypothetical protein [Cytobacillus dafuensis]QED47966.1 hypothetical protein FSZ17_12315 [Cytobacillus dafuensis]